MTHYPSPVLRCCKYVPQLRLACTHLVAAFGHRVGDVALDPAGQA